MGQLSLSDIHLLLTSPFSDPATTPPVTPFPPPTMTVTLMNPMTMMRMAVLIIVSRSVIYRISSICLRIQHVQLVFILYNTNLVVTIVLNNIKRIDPLQRWQ